MKEYEAILEIINQCPLNRDRDTFFEEIKTDDLDEFVKKKFAGQEITYDKTVAKDGSVIFDLMSAGFISVILLPRYEVIEYEEKEHHTGRSAAGTGGQLSPVREPFPQHHRAEKAEPTDIIVPGCGERSGEKTALDGEQLLVK